MCSVSLGCGRFSGASAMSPGYALPWQRAWKGAHELLVSAKTLPVRREAARIHLEHAGWRRCTYRSSAGGLRFAESICTHAIDRTGPGYLTFPRAPKHRRTPSTTCNTRNTRTKGLDAPAHPRTRTKREPCNTRSPFKAVCYSSFVVLCRNHQGASGSTRYFFLA